MVVLVCALRNVVHSETQVQHALSHLRQSLVTEYPSVAEALLYLRLRLQVCCIQSLVNYCLFLQFATCLSAAVCVLAYG